MELKSCPFCGGKATLKTGATNPYYGGLLVWVTVSCNQCSINKTNKVSYQCYDLGRNHEDYNINNKYDKDIVKSKQEEIKPAIIEWWNRRVYD